MILKLGPGLTLDMAANTTKLPFLVAATREEDGKEQFMCPVIGEANPRLQDAMCHRSYVSSEDKSLRVGIFGIPPYFYGKPKCQKFLVILTY